MAYLPTSAYRARVLVAQGHTVRLMPPEYVKPYLKSNKNDFLDAEAIAEAVTRPTIRFVPARVIGQAPRIGSASGCPGQPVARRHRANQLSVTLDESTCYHPLLLFNKEGNCLAAKLRPGNVHSAEDWEEVLLPEIQRQQELGKEVVFRADAAFAKPEIYEASLPGLDLPMSTVIQKVPRLKNDPTHVIVVTDIGSREVYKFRKTIGLVMLAIPTACPFCSCGCGLYLLAKKGHLVGVAPSETHPVSGGRLCARGWSAHEAALWGDRLRQPLLQRNGKLEPVSWDEALDHVAERLKELMMRASRSEF